MYQAPALVGYYAHAPPISVAFVTWSLFQPEGTTRLPEPETMYKGLTYLAISVRDDVIYDVVPHVSSPHFQFSGRFTVLRQHPKWHSLHH